MTFGDRALLIAGGYGNPGGVIIRIGEIQRSSELLFKLRAVVLSCWTRSGEAFGQLNRYVGGGCITQGMIAHNSHFGAVIKGDLIAIG